jgi:transcriptional regulator with XRE-family HTH domain
MNVRGADIVLRIDTLLEARNLKRQVLADNGKFRVENIAKWKTRNSIPAGDVLLGIADYLDVSMRWLLTGEDDAGLAPDERDLLNSYRRLDDRDRQEVVGIITLKLERYPQKGVSRLEAAG